MRDGARVTIINIRREARQRAARALRCYGGYAALR